MESLLIGHEIVIKNILHQEIVQTLFCLLTGLNLNFMQMFSFSETTQAGRNIYQQGPMMN